jgi:transcriptional regulator with XRE-family HTH domain
VNAVSYERDRVEPTEWDRPEMRAALAARDITRVYRLLQRIGFSQQRIAALTGQSQPEVSAIIHGRKVMAYDVLARIADGLGVPRGYMGLAYAGEDLAELADPPAAEVGWSGSAAEGAGEVAGGGEAEQLGRRGFLGQAAAITVGAAVLGPELAERPAAAAAAVPTPTPARIGAADVEQVRQATAALRVLDYRYGGGSCREAAVAQLASSGRLLRSDAGEEVGRQLRIALADLHNLVGWISLDLGQHDAARHYFLRALRLAKQAEEPDLVANILYRTGRISLPGDPAEAVRMFRLGQLAAQEIDSPLTNAILAGNQAWAMGMLGDAEGAHRALGTAEEELAAANLATAPGWARFFDESDLHALHGMAYLALGEHEPRYTEQAIERLSDASDLRVPEMARSKAFDLAALAVAHFRQGDVDHGATVAHQALDAAGRLQSVRAVDRLRPLVAEAATRRDRPEARDLTERLTTTMAAMSPAPTADP